MLTRIRLLLAVATTLAALFAFAPKASADRACVNMSIYPILTSPTICVPIP